jgi:hypothetical protein
MNKVHVDFYVYVYLDPRKSGVFLYLDYLFENEPFYVGRGRGTRCYDHLKYFHKTYKSYKIHKIMKMGLKPIIVKVKENLCLKEANLLEKKLIEVIGRIDLGNGLLTNMSSGGEGNCGGRPVLYETRQKMREVRLNKTYEEMYGVEKAESLKLNHSNNMKGNKNFPSRKGILSGMRNMSYESFYGCEKANDIKKKLSISHLGDRNSSFNKIGDKSFVYGQKRSVEQVDNMKEVQSKRFSERRKEINLKLEENLRKDMKSYFVIFFNNGEERALFKKKSVLNKKFKVSRDKIERIVFVYYKEDKMYELKVDLENFLDLNYRFFK